MHAICPFCDCQVTHGGVEFGASFLHDECFATLQREMDDESSVVESIPLLENSENAERKEVA
jgi:hypothetical protein